MNRLGSNLNCRRKIKCQQIKIQRFQNQGQDGGQDGGSKLELPITEPFMNRFDSDLYCMHNIKGQKQKLTNSKMAAKMADKMSV